MLTREQAIEIARKWHMDEDVRKTMDAQVGFFFWERHRISPEEALEEFDVPIPDEYLENE